MQVSEVRRRDAECTGSNVDCWFDSGAMPYAQHHYPFENKDLFEQQFPASFISEAVDQTRGWFYSLLAESTLLFNKPAIRTLSFWDWCRMRTVRR
jgi:isoleucyl-tRNA synthetase